MIIIWLANQLPEYGDRMALFKARLNIINLAELGKPWIEKVEEPFEKIETVEEKMARLEKICFN